MSQDDKLILSATAIVLRDTSKGLEVLLLQRNKAIKVHGGNWVFPGGKADPEDIKEPVKKFNLFDLNAEEKQLVARHSACREAHEEAGLDIKSEQLIPCSRWITPETMKKRFDAFFFMCQSNRDDIEIDDGEIQDFRWLSPKQALSENADGKLPLPPPTYLTLLQLSDFSSVHQAINALGQETTEYRPRLVLTENGFHSIYQQDAMYENPSTNIDSPCHRLILDKGNYTYLEKL